MSMWSAAARTVGSMLAPMLSLPLAGSLAHAQPFEIAWHDRYNGPAQGTSQFDIPNAAAFRDGILAVGGQIQTDAAGADLIVINYDKAGGRRWVATYDGPASGSDTAFGVAIDSRGDVIAVGASAAADTDYIILKFAAADGRLLWERRYAEPGQTNEIARAVALDAFDRIYVTGQSGVNDLDSDIATLCFDPDGTERWSRRFSGPGVAFDRGSAIAVDATGRVYVAGVSDGGPSAVDVITLCYDAEGEELWTRRYSPPGVSFDRAWAIGLTSDGVAVAGEAQFTATSYDYVTLRYTREGDLNWVRTYNGPANSIDRAYALAVDAADNVYVTGSSRGGPGNADFATLKYAPNGDELWIRRYSGGTANDEARAIGLDGAGGVYVAGESFATATGLDFAVVKYDVTGVERWVARYDGPSSLSDLPRAMAVDRCGDVYLAGYVTTTSPTATDIETLRIRQPALFGCIGDLDGDGAVGLQDLSNFLSNFGRSGPLTPFEGDLDCSGRIDLRDLAEFLSRFGAPCE